LGSTQLTLQMDIREGFAPSTMNERSLLFTTLDLNDLEESNL